MRTPIGLSAMVLAFALAACASHQASAPPAAAPAPPPPVAAADGLAPGGSVAAPGVSVAPPEPPPPPGDVVVAGPGRELNVPADPRTAAQRTADIHAWDQCVTRAQSVGDSDPTRPQMDSPEDICARSLGMSGRTAVPASRLQHR